MGQQCQKIWASGTNHRGLEIILYLYIIFFWLKDDCHHHYVCIRRPSFFLMEWSYFFCSASYELFLKLHKASYHVGDLIFENFNCKTNSVLCTVGCNIYLACLHPSFIYVFFLCHLNLFSLSPIFAQDISVCRTVTPSAAMGIIAPRDFVDVILVKRYEDGIITSNGA